MGERSFAHTCESGAGHRSWLRGSVNVAKWYVNHAAACNLGALLRELLGVRTPRSLQGGSPAVRGALLGWVRPSCNCPGVLSHSRAPGKPWPGMIPSPAAARIG